MGNEIFLYGSRFNRYGWKNIALNKALDIFDISKNYSNNFDRYSSRVYIHYNLDLDSKRLDINNLSIPIVCGPSETTPTPTVTPTPYTTIPPTVTPLP
jgi:hypothetical protein